MQSRNINCTNTIECRNDSLYTSSLFSNPYSNRACCEQARGRQGQSLSVHHWTEISISMPNIEMEIRTLNVLLEITNDIVSLLPVGFRTPGRPSGFTVTIIKSTCVRSHSQQVFVVLDRFQQHCTDQVSSGTDVGAVEGLIIALTSSNAETILYILPRRFFIHTLTDSAPNRAGAVKAMVCPSITGRRSRFRC